MSPDVVVPRSREQVNWAVICELSSVITKAKVAAEQGHPLSVGEVLGLMEARVVELRLEGARE